MQLETTTSTGATVPGPDAAGPGLLAPRVAWSFLVVATGAGAVAAAGGETVRTACYLATIVATIGAVVVGARHNRPSRTVWVAAAAMAVCFLVVEIAASLRTASRTVTGAGVVEDVFRTAGMLLYVAVIAAVAAVRRGRTVGSMLGDAAVVAAGAWIVCWVGLLRPTLELSEEPLLTTLVHGFYQPIAVGVVFMLAMLVFAETFRPTALWFLAGAILSALVGDLGYALRGAGHISDARLVLFDSAYILAYGFAGAMFLHPSVRSMTEPQPIGQLRAASRRSVLTTAALLVPVVVLVATDPSSSTDRAVRLVSAAGLCIAVTLRVGHAVRSNTSAQRALLRNAQHDTLTGLPNRVLLGEQITEALHEAWRSSCRPTVFFIDIDRFKNINDSLGHAVGDDVLRMLGRRLRAAIPDHVTVGRISGDEFIALDPSTRTMGEALALAERILRVFHEPVHVSAGDIYVTASIGVAMAPGAGVASAEELQRNADTAMYRAKAAGRNCVAVFDDSMHERVAQRLETESALHRALDRRELMLAYQPIVDLVSGEVLGFEALMRWHLADGRVVSPAEFIPIAEETGLIVPIGAWSMLEALDQLRRWIADGVCSPEATMSVNLSPRQLQDPSLVASVTEALLRTGLDSGRLWLEVTENVMVDEPDQALVTMRRIRALGCHLAIDDFGTGYSSLSMMRRFPLERMKIDRSFVSGVAEDAAAKSLVHTIVAMADALGLEVVAEGVETVAQLQVLTGLGCRNAQGFLLSPPVAADAMAATIKRIEHATTWAGGTQLAWPDV